MEGSRRRPAGEQLHAEGFVEETTDVTKLKEEWQNYRVLFIPLDKVFEWNPPHFPAITIGILTFLFALVWYLEPSALTTLSLLLLVVGCVEVSLPVLSNHFYSIPDNWNAELEAHHERACVRLSHAKRHMNNAWSSLMHLKKDKPSLYLLTILAALLVGAWIGSLMDNLLLVYLIVLVATLVPGLRKHGILQKITAHIPLLNKKKIQ